MKMLKFIQSITTAIKGASLTAKIIGVTTAVVVAGGTTAVIVVQANSSVQEPQDTETNDNSDKDTEQEKNEDKEENEDQNENLDNSDNQENKTDEQQKTDNPTTNSGTARPSSSSNSNQSSNSSQQTSKPVEQPQPATPKAEFNLNDSIQIMQFGYTCNKFLGGDYSDPSNYVSAPGGGWIEISATGRRFSKGSGTCPDGYDLNGGAVPRVLDEYWCNLYGLSCDRW